MKKFIIRIILFLIIGYLLGEVVVRAKKLTSDMPQRLIDNSGIQRYKTGQKGYYEKTDFQWKVNKYGWLGVSDIENKEKRISIIGDSYIENMMNPITCNQGYLLQEKLNNVGFIEAGRSGITFIEGMEISKMLDSLKINTHLVYVSLEDFNESISNKVRYEDRLQLDIDKQRILTAKLKSPGIKKILYNTKFMYYLYKRFPVFVSKQNKGETENKTIPEYNTESYSKLLNYCSKNYDLTKIVLVFHPNTPKTIINLSRANGFNTIELNLINNKSWDLSAADGHWSCYGHDEATKQVYNYLKFQTIQ